MSNQDDLENDYKVLSNEKPSASTDQLILKAAAEAIEDKKQAPERVVQGKFSSRRWHRPVSIAAAAIITVTIISSLKPWSVTVPEYSPEQVMPMESKMAEDEELFPKENDSSKSDKKRTLVEQETLKDVTESRAQRAPAALSLKKKELSSEAMVADALNYNEAPHLMTTSLYPKPKLLADFELIDHNNRTFSQQQLKGKWSIIFFGFTSCADVCPTTLTALAEVADSLDPEILNQTQFIFVSIDPEQDSVDRLAEYVPYYHADFIGLTGVDVQLENFSRSLGAVYEKIPMGESYSMSHSNTVFIVNPEGRRKGVFSHISIDIIDIKLIAKDLTTLVRFYK